MLCICKKNIENFEFLRIMEHQTHVQKMQIGTCIQNIEDDGAMLTNTSGDLDLFLPLKNSGRPRFSIPLIAL